MNSLIQIEEWLMGLEIMQKGKRFFNRLAETTETIPMAFRLFPYEERIILELYKNLPTSKVKPYTFSFLNNIPLKIIRYT